MPIDTQKLIDSKESIINKIKIRGPSLPVQIAREANINLLFASAYLSELYNERKVKMSNMKVGSSPLYYLEGQEALLENFIQYLNHKEREAHTLLKSQKLLNDDKIEPAIRVAIRAIKDFAVPVRIKVGEDSKLFWKHYLASDEEITELAKVMLGLKKETKEVKKEEDKQKKLEENEKKEERKEERKEDVKSDERTSQLNELRQKIDDISNELKNPQNTQEKDKKKKIIPESKFVKHVKEYLQSKNIEILEILDEKKKDFLAKVRTDSPFGKQDYLLTAKEKKKITDEDLTIAIHKAQTEKMPALFIAPGEIDKKSLDHANTWKNLVKFSKL